MYNYFMDKRDFIVIENETKTKEPVRTVSSQTNPIAKKFVEFHNEKEKFSVKELFKKR